MGYLSKQLSKYVVKTEDNRILLIDEVSRICKKDSIETGNGIGTIDLLDHDPIHAIYVLAHHHLSLFSEEVSVIPLMEEYYDIVSAAEEEYLPTGPPMSPLTKSYFTFWAFFDVRLGPDKETLGTCFLDVGEKLNIYQSLLEIVRLMQNSRMGLYEHQGVCQGKVVLQELVTDRKNLCFVPAGYQGEKGELWFVRILPSPFDMCKYSVVMNTPYVLRNESKKDWEIYIKKILPTAESTNTPFEAYGDLMKYGLTLHYWNEFIFSSYYKNQYDAIFLQGLPDILP